MILYGKKQMYKRIFFALKSFHYLTKKELQGVCTSYIDYTDLRFCSDLSSNLTSGTKINENEDGLLYLHCDSNRLKDPQSEYVLVKRAMAKILIELNIKYNLGIKNYHIEYCNRKSHINFYLHIETKIEGKSVNFCVYYIPQSNGIFNESVLSSFLKQHNKEDRIIFLIDNISYLREIASTASKYDLVNNIANTYILPDYESLLKNFYIEEQYSIVSKK